MRFPLGRRMHSSYHLDHCYTYCIYNIRSIRPILFCTTYRPFHPTIHHASCTTLRSITLPCRQRGIHRQWRLPPQEIEHDVNCPPPPSLPVLCSTGSRVRVLVAPRCVWSVFDTRNITSTGPALSSLCHDTTASKNPGGTQGPCVLKQNSGGTSSVLYCHR